MYGYIVDFSSYLRHIMNAWSISGLFTGVIPCVTTYRLLDA